MKIKIIYSKNDYFASSSGPNVVTIKTWTNSHIGYIVPSMRAHLTTRKH